MYFLKRIAEGIANFHRYPRRQLSVITGALLILALGSVLTLSTTQAVAQDNGSDSPAVSRNSVIETSGSLDRFMSFDPEDSNDTQFLNQLLLSHGLDLQLGEDRRLGQTRFNELIESVGEGGFNQAQEAGLLSDVSDSVTLSFWTGAAATAGIAQRDANAPVVWRTLWWEVNTQFLNGTPVLPDERESNFDKSTTGLSNNLKALVSRLADAGYQLSVDELCAMSNRVDSDIQRWLSQGSVIDGLPAAAYQDVDGSVFLPAQRLADRLSNFENGVSRKWRLIWVECEDGLTLVRVPALQTIDRVPGASESSDLFKLPAFESVKTIGPVRQIKPVRKTEPLTDGPVASEQRDTDYGSDGTQSELDGSFVVPSPFGSGQAMPDNLPGPESVPGQLQVNDDVPEGFEALAGPQFVFIDLYFNDELLGSTGIMATPEDFTFDDPAQVAELLQGNVQGEKMVEWLSEPLATNGHLACFAEEDPPGCGQLEGDPVAAIYNEMLLRVDLFVSANHQALQKQDIQRHLPAPETDNTAILSVYALSSKLAGEENSTDLSGRALFGYGRGLLTVEGDYNDRQERKRLREFKITHYFNSHEMEAGTYSFQPGGALPDIDLVGAGFGTSFKTRVDLEHAFSSQLVVFLSTRSVVQLLINDRVYAGDSYAAGNQVLDTSDLPDGTYEVEIRTIDQTGTTRTETRVFTKSTQIPPAGESVYNVTAGNVLVPDSERSIPEASDTSILGMNVSRRLNDQSAWRLGLLQFGSHFLAQAEYLYLGERVSFQATGSVGQSNTVAVGMQSGIALESVSFNLAINQFSSDHEPGDNAVEEVFFVPDFEQISLSANRGFDSINVGARSSFRREDSREGISSSREQYSLYAQKPLFHSVNGRAFLSTSFQHTPEDERVELKFDWFFERAQFNGSLGLLAFETNEADSGLQGDASLGWRSSADQVLAVRSGAYVSASDSLSSYGARTELRHPWFLATAATDITESSDNQSVQNSVASLSAHFGVDRRGVGMGGSDFAQAGVIVDVTGEPEGEKFDILVNSSRVSTGSIGTTQFIGLQPFRTYDVKFVPHSLLGNGIADSNHTFTLFPGTVHRVVEVARREVLLIATLVDNQGNPLTDALLKTERNTLLVDSDGILQAEVHAGDTLTVKLASGDTCQFVVPNSADEDVVVPDEPIVCE